MSVGVREEHKDMQANNRDLTQWWDQWHLINIYECVILSSLKAEVGLDEIRRKNCSSSHSRMAFTVWQRRLSGEYQMLEFKSYLCNLLCDSGKVT